MAGSAVKDRVVYPLQKRVINPIVMLAHDRAGPVSRGRRGGPACSARSGRWRPDRGIPRTVRHHPGRTCEPDGRQPL